MAEGVRPLCSSLTLSVVVAVPGEVGGVGAEGGLGREGKRAAVEVGEFEVRSAGEDGFGNVGLGDLDAQVVVDGPEACIEEVVGCRINNGV
jgi:hypothetical protein